MTDRKRPVETQVPPTHRMHPGDEAPPGTPGTGEGLCPICQGSGRLNGDRCESCGGTGRVIQGIGGA
ncbi:MAG: hypothetical protein HQL39_05405 [Alphaproteobacteria bacterium]|nr:hypothetical protein [Alphaproteobacteria bacterium]MBF0372839.1 hypothetical protein [Alphaproteobacteria bacterium]